MTAYSRSKVLVVLFLLSSVLLRKCSPCPSFTSPVEEGRAVCPGEELTYTCTIDGTGSSATVWRITPQPDTCPGGVVALLHSTLGDPPIECGPFSAQLTANDSNCFTSTLTVTASPDLGGIFVKCEDNPGNIAGNASITIETGMLELVVTPTYENSDSELKKIMTTWNAICSPVTEYNITVACGTFVDTSLVPLDECPGGTCVSEVNIASGATGDCTVSLSAAGLSEQTAVPLNNDFLDVMIIADNDPTVVTHFFQPGFLGKACFRIQFAFIDEAGVLVNMPKSTSTCRGAGENTDALEVSIPPATPYSYVATTFDCGCSPGQFQQSVIIEGAGTTGDCFAAQLFGGNINGICPCGTATNGGCLDNTDPMLPTYLCCDGYKLQGSPTLTCGLDGQWSDSPPICVPADSNIINIVVIILIVVAVILLLIAIAFMVCFIVYYCEAKNLKKVAGEQRLGSSPSELKTY